jgi:hypothetical protein
LEARARTSLGVSPKLERKQPVKDIGDPMLNIYTLMFQRLAIANGHGWNRFGEALTEVARTFGVSHSTISRLHEASSF